MIKITHTITLIQSISLFYLIIFFEAPSLITDNILLLSVT